MALSLILIGFLIFYWYNKLMNKRDIIAPWKTQFMRQVGEPAKTAALKMINQLEGSLDKEVKENNAPGPDESGP